mmetsp:Transcript_19508/g.14199  ORF Transcript_19508/g.14199 Transcript_19508/m.14199 type:complete len:134 (+) Transcript_19508:401-802(+)
MGAMKRKLKKTPIVIVPTMFMKHTASTNTELYTQMLPNIAILFRHSTIDNNEYIMSMYELRKQDRMVDTSRKKMLRPAVPAMNNIAKEMYLNSVFSQVSRSLFFSYVSGQSNTQVFSWKYKSLPAGVLLQTRH